MRATSFRVVSQYPCWQDTERFTVMTKYEKTARQLAAELSKIGERDWRNYVALARQVDDSLERQFQQIISPQFEGDLISDEFLGP